MELTLIWLWLTFIFCITTVLSGKSQRLLYVSHRDIRVLDFHKTKFSKNLVVKDNADIGSIDFCYDSNVVCWTDVTNELIKCSSMKNASSPQWRSNVIRIIKSAVVSSGGMAVDWVTKKIYWADSESQRIEAAEIYGKNRKVLYWRDVQQPQCLALVPFDGLVFWCEWGEAPRIVRAGMNGDLSTKIAVASREIAWPVGLSVDLADRRLLWLDSKTQIVWSVDFNGERRTKVIGGLLDPYSLSFANGVLYWTDWHSSAVHFCPITSQGACGDVKSVTLKQQPSFIRAYGPQQGAKSECTSGRAGCSHLCLVAPSASSEGTVVTDSMVEGTAAPEIGFTCACPTGINLVDKNTCDEGPNEMVLLARRSDIRIISLDTPDRSPVVAPVQSVTHAVAVDFDPLTRFIYWSDDEEFVIQRARLDGSEQEVVVRSDGLDSDGLAVDWLAGNLYWTDAHHNWIEVSRLNGSSRKILVRGKMDEPRAIAVYPEGGFMFWTDWGKRSRIERAFLDGSNRVPVVDRDLGWPNGVAVDPSDEKIYWIDAKIRRIEVSDFDGVGRRTVLKEDILHAFGFSLDADFLYWTDWQKRSVERVHKYNVSYREILVDHIPDVMGLKAVSLGSKRDGFSPCTKDNGGCSHLCFNRPQNQHVCDCPFGFELGSDGMSCVFTASYVLVGAESIVLRLSVDSRSTATIPVVGFDGTSSMTYDADDRLYWVNSVNRTIRRAFLNGSESSQVGVVGLSGPASLALDKNSAHLYWAESTTGRIEVYSLKNGYRRAVLWGLVSPHALVVDGSRGFLFWLEESGKDEQKLMRAHLDGSKPSALLRIRGDPRYLTLDLQGGRVAWRDPFAALVRAVDVEGKRTEVLVEGVEGTGALVIGGGYVFWADEERGVLRKSRLKTDLDSASKSPLVEDRETEVMANVSSVTGLLFVDKNGGIENDHPTSSPDPDSAHFSHSPENPCYTSSEALAYCPNFCFFVPGSERGFRCSCAAHHIYHGANKSCTPIPNFLLVSGNSSVNQISVDTSGGDPASPLPLRNFSSRIRKIDFDPVSEYLFWIDSGVRAGFAGISRSFLNGTQSRTIAEFKEGDPFDLVVDGSTQMVYWTCRRTDAVNAVRFDGFQIGTIFSDRGEVKPRYLSLHASLSMLFFTNESPQLPSIDALDVSTGHRQVLVSGDSLAPTSLVVDTSSDTLYWTNSAPPSIQAADIYGHKRRVFLETGTIRPFAVAVSVDRVFWLDDGAVRSADKFTGDGVFAVTATADAVRDLVAVQLFPQGETKSYPCLSGGKKCSHICSNSPPRDSYVIEPPPGNDLSNSSPGHPQVFPPGGQSGNHPEVVPSGGHGEGSKLRGRHFPLVDSPPGGRYFSLEDSPSHLTPKDIPSIFSPKSSPAMFPIGKQNVSPLSLKDLPSLLPSAPDRYIHSPRGPDFTCLCPRGMTLASDGVACRARRVCNPQQFTCVASNKCIPLEWRCNGAVDCPNASDEVGCGVTHCGDPNLFRCSSGLCIENEMVCDGVNQCADGSDEVQCCPPGEALCRSTGICVPCSVPGTCPGPMTYCPYPITQIHGRDVSLEEKGRVPYIVISLTSAVILMCVVASAIYYRRRLTDIQACPAQSIKMCRTRGRLKVGSGGKVYTEVDSNAPSVYYHASNGSRRRLQQATAAAVLGRISYQTNSSESNALRCNASSSSSSVTQYPRETLNPPPTPVVDIVPSHSRDTNCCYPDTTVSAPHSYRHYKAHNRPPPPTPCSTDVGDDSDFYSSSRGDSPWRTTGVPMSPRGHLELLSSPGDSPWRTTGVPMSPRGHLELLSSPRSNSSFADCEWEPLPPPPSPATDVSYAPRTPCHTPASNSTSES